MPNKSLQEVENSKYELMIILFPDLGEANTEKELSEIKEMISSLNGEVYNEDVWGLRDLAYPIKKQTEGYYIVLNVNLPPSKVSELEKTLGIHQTVIRHLIIKTPFDYQIKSLSEYQQEAEAQKKEEEKKEEEKKQKEPKKKPKVASKKIEEEPKEEKVEKEEKPEPKKKKEPKLDDVDKKLKSIIDDPDISL